LNNASQKGHQIIEVNLFTRCQKESAASNLVTSDKVDQQHGALETPQGMNTFIAEVEVVLQNPVRHIPLYQGNEIGQISKLSEV
jgi:hypothetical protein